MKIHISIEYLTYALALSIMFFSLSLIITSHFFLFSTFFFFIFYTFFRLFSFVYFSLFCFFIFLFFIFQIYDDESDGEEFLHIKKVWGSRESGVGTGSGTSKGVRESGHNTVDDNVCKRNKHDYSRKIAFHRSRLILRISNFLIFV